MSACTPAEAAGGEAALARARDIIGPVEGHELSDEQLAAIVGAGHNTLVLAGAGTGKTTTINGYVAWLLATWRARPDEILVLSFTRASAEEMGERIRNQTGQRVRATTFHALGLDICRRSGAARRDVVDETTMGRVIRDAFDGRRRTDPRYRALVVSMMPSGVRDACADTATGAGAPTDGGVESSSAASPAMPSAASRTAEAYAGRLLESARTVIAHMRARDLDVAALRALNEERGGMDKGRNRDMIALIEPLYDAYMRHLRDVGGIDFAGMIGEAAAAVRAGRFDHGWKYVLIDEYQDMSRPRCALIRALRERRGFALFAVGDDWQSIYRFAGSDIRLILDFDHVWGAWGPTRTFLLTVTRRFGQALIDASGSFVMADPSLNVKHLQAAAVTRGPAVGVIAGDDARARCEAVLDRLRRLPRRSSVMMLGRYRADLDQLTRHAPAGAFVTDGDRLTFAERPDLAISFMTIHRSKGLQCDVAFLLSCAGGVRGFPGAVREEPLVGLLLPQAEAYPYAEERRLCYVAMTRCRRRVFLVVDPARPSRFVYELRERVCPTAFRGVKLADRCPSCGEALAERAGSGGRRFVGCTAWPACTFTRDAGE
ncbi:UvrD-helicase domain-containing protein [Bifidobacterium samirii]|uniref:UvrD-helicase domain-containing protein n=1 Tax=Bifidobacterium samirii TaxID=2306974 RepID=UPI001F497589|nr:UvrD-helicase domain-containing protein [Bifidobacterium samirii]